MNNNIITHDLSSRIWYPNHHIRTFSKQPLINIQSNVPINEGDALLINGERRIVKRIISKAPTNEEIFELNGNEGLYKRGVTDYYVIRLDAEYLSPQRRLFYDFIDGTRKNVRK